VAEKEAYSGHQIYDAIRQIFELEPIPFYVPYLVLQTLARIGDGIEIISGNRLPFDSEVLDSLLGSACYSPAAIERELGWKANISLHQGLEKMKGLLL
jgi:hypothetical protein